MYLILLLNPTLYPDTDVYPGTDVYPANENTPVPPTPTHKIAVDGYWGQDTRRKAQEVFGTGYVDGIVSNQYKYYASKNKGLLSSTFQWLDNPKGGSNLIYAMQKS